MNPKSGFAVFKSRFAYMFLGVLVGILLSASFALADNPISLIVNGQQITCDVPPQLINGRVMVPARALAEALGAIVTWDSSNNAVVVVTSNSNSTQLQNNSSTNNSSITQGTANDGDNAVTVITYNGCRAIATNNITYFNADDYAHQYPNNISWDGSTHTTTIKGIAIPTVTIEVNNELVSQSPNDFQIYNGQTYFNVKYF